MFNDFYGIESGSDRVLEQVIQKGLPHGVEDLKRCARLLGKSKLKGIYSFMCNLPSETRDELAQSMALADYMSSMIRRPGSVLCICSLPRNSTL